MTEEQMWNQMISKKCNGTKHSTSTPDICTPDICTPDSCTPDSCTPDTIMTHEQVLTELMKINQELMKHITLNGKQTANLFNLKMSNSLSDLRHQWDSQSTMAQPPTTHMGFEKKQSTNKRHLAAASTQHIPTSRLHIDEENLIEITKLKMKKCDTQLKINALEKQIDALRAKNNTKRSRNNFKVGKDKNNFTKQQEQRMVQDKAYINQLTKELHALKVTLSFTKGELFTKQDMLTMNRPSLSVQPTYDRKTSSVTSIRDVPSNHSTGTRHTTSLEPSTNSSNSHLQKTSSSKTSSSASKFFGERSASFITNLTRRVNQLVEPIAQTGRKFTTHSRQRKNVGDVLTPSRCSIDQHNIHNAYGTGLVYRNTMTVSANDLSEGLSKHHKSTPQSRSCHALSCDSRVANNIKPDKFSSIWKKRVPTYRGKMTTSTDKVVISTDRVSISIDEITTSSDEVTTRTSANSSHKITTRIDKVATGYADSNEGLPTISETMAQLDDLEDFFTTRLAELNIADVAL